MAKIVPVVQLAMHAKSSAFYGRSYGRTVARPNFFGLMGYYYFVQLCYASRAASSAMSRLLHMLDKTHRF